MPQLFSSIQQVNGAVTGTASIVFNPANTSGTAFGPLGSFPAGTVLKDVVVINTGASAVYAGMGSASANGTTGAQIQPGGSLIFYGYSVTAGTATTGQIWAQTAGSGAVSSTVAGLATLSPATVI